MTDKTPIGVPFFDAEFGGLFRKRVALATGRAHSGKTLLGLQFLRQGLRMNESCLMLSTHSAQNLAITADAMGLPVASALDNGLLTLLEYSEFVPGRDQEANILLPPNGFMELKAIIEENAVQRVVLDTVLPWATLAVPEHQAEHIFSLVRAFERLGVTALFLLPKPVSVAARRLRKMIEDTVPISIVLDFDVERDARSWQTTRYLGAQLPSAGTPFAIEPQRGFVAQTNAPAAVLAPAPAPAPESSAAFVAYRKSAAPTRAPLDLYANLELQT